MRYAELPYVAGNLVRTNSVLAVGKQPHSTEPFVQLDWRILEDRPDLNRELLPAFKASPRKTRLNKRQTLRRATRALRAFRPFGLGNSIQANHRVRKVPDCLKQPAFFVQLDRFHMPILHPEAV